jgi:hypothetical protein
MIGSKTRRLGRKAVLGALVAVTAIATLAPAAFRSADALANESQPQVAPLSPGRHASPREERRMENVSMRRVASMALAEIPIVAESLAVEGDRLPDGEEIRFEGMAPNTERAASTSSISVASVSAAQVWPYPNNVTPNAQVGRLYYYDSIVRKWFICSGTLINTPNRSLVATAGHCVFNADPDRNGYVGTNAYWYTSFVFCPGHVPSAVLFQGCTLGQWNYRLANVTGNWFYGVGTYRQVAWADDFAVVVLNRDSWGRGAADVYGSQGIIFNQAVNQFRTLLGYPAAYDDRFPQYRFVDGDLYYCQGTDTYAAGLLTVACTLVGGASGGPWLTNVNTQWLGYVNSVNSNKTSGTVMRGPYFDTSELTLYQMYASA